MYVESGPELHVHSIESKDRSTINGHLPDLPVFFLSPQMVNTTKSILMHVSRVRCIEARRPVQETELVPYLGLAHTYFENHGDIWGAAKYGVRAILTSPHFLPH